MKFKPLVVFGLFYTACHTSVLAEVITGRVIKVADGDTITILDNQKKQHKIRLAQIDAPEKSQPWGKASRDYLNAWIYENVVTVDYDETDRYGRIVGEVYIGQYHVNSEMLRNGNAWVYTRYAKDKRLFELQESAKRNQFGLWSLPQSDQVPPWEWRKSKK